RHDGRMTSAEAVAVAGGARWASPQWPPDTPQALRRPGRAWVAVAALVWLLAGASMSSLNKWIFTVHGFGRPLLLSALHMLAAALAFSLLALTSALTVHVLGNLTVVGNLVLSRLLFGSCLSTLSYVGIALTLSGMFLYHNCEFLASWAARRGFWRRDQPGKGL
ncbi:hypothetical protein E2I00_009995, partial [Balaenoptera physalus]